MRRRATRLLRLRRRRPVLRSTRRQMIPLPGATRHDSGRHRFLQGPADRTSDRTAQPPPEDGHSHLHRFHRLLLFFPADLQHSRDSLRVGGRPSCRTDLHGAAGAVLHPSQGGLLRSHLHRVSGHREPGLHVRRAGALQARAWGVPAVPGRPRRSCSRSARHSCSSS